MSWLISGTQNGLEKTSNTRNIRTGVTVCGAVFGIVSVVCIALDRFLCRNVTKVNSPFCISDCDCRDTSQLTVSWVKTVKGQLAVSLMWLFRLSILAWASNNSSHSGDFVVLSSGIRSETYFRIPVNLDSSRLKMSFSRINFLMDAFRALSDYLYLSNSDSNNLTWFCSRCLKSVSRFRSIFTLLSLSPVLLLS